MMNSAPNTSETNFYVSGGTMRHDAPSYVERQADKELYEGLHRGDFCYLLTSRQMGKSSLMVRTAARLRQEGVAVAVLDLTAIGQNLTAEQWYDGLLGRLGRQLDQEDELEEFWLEHERMGPLQRFMTALREVVLARPDQRLVIFVDEIDAVRSLPFSTDEFFSAIRECYNRRTQDTEFNRLTFCLLGVAAPSDLIRDTRTTPFNIGRRIELNDFSEAEAEPLASGLERAGKLGSTLLGRVLYWTGGQPYLTQRLCQAVAADMGVTSARGVDRLCEELFLSGRARERDDNLLFVRERLLRSEVDQAALLDLYAQVRRQGLGHQPVRDDETNPLVSILRLSGITRVLEGYLRVRNRIYYWVFDDAWVKANMPDAEVRRQQAAYRRGFARALGIAAAMALLAIYAANQAANARQQAANARQQAAKAQQASTQAASNLRLAERREAALEKSKSALKAAQIRTTKQRDRANNEADRANNEAKRARLARQLADRETIRARLAATRESDARRRADDNEQEAQRSRLRAVQALREKEKLNEDNFKEDIKYYAYWTNRWGFSEGVGELKPEHLPQRHVVYKFTRHGLKNPVDKVEAIRVINGREVWTTENVGEAYISSDKEADSPATRQCVWYFERDATSKAKARISDEKAYDRMGRLVYHYLYTSPTMAVNLDANGYSRAHPDTGAAYVQFKWSTREGFPVEQRYKDDQHKDVKDSTGSYGQRSGYDKRGLVKWAEYLKEDGKPMLLEGGYARLEYKYDARGNTTEESYFGTNGQRVLRRDGEDRYARITYAYDDRGNRTKMTFRGLDDRPVLLKESGYASVRYAYDGEGNQTEKIFLGLNGKPVLIKDGEDRYARITYAYDDHGNRTSISYKGLNGKLVRLKAGYAKVSYAYDKSYNQTKISYFGPDGKQLAHESHSVYWWTRAYNNQGKETERVFHGRNNERVSIEDEGYSYARMTTKYDARGNKTEVARFDENNKRASVSKYDVHGHEIEFAYFRSGGKLASIYKFDAHGKKTQRSWIGSDGKRESVSKYDARGNVIEEAYFGHDDKLALNEDGYARVTKKYDVRDNAIEEAYFGLGDKPTLVEDGYARVTKKYDAHDNVIEEAYFGVDGQPVRLKDGYARVTEKYDAHGNQVEQAYFGECGQPVRLKGSYARVISEYDQSNNEIKTSYFGPDGKPTADQFGVYWRTKAYNKQGKEIERAFFGRDGEPVLNEDGYARVTKKYNARGNLIEVAYFGVDGKPTLHKDGFARLTVTYDEHNVMMGVVRYGLNGETLRNQVVIQEVAPDSEAQRVGLQPGDVVVSYNGKPATNSSTLGQLVSEFGEELREIKIRRNGVIHIFSVAPGKLGLTWDEILAPEEKPTSRAR